MFVGEKKSCSAIPHGWEEAKTKIYFKAEQTILSQ